MRNRPYRDGGDAGRDADVALVRPGAAPTGMGFPWWCADDVPVFTIRYRPWCLAVRAKRRYQDTAAMRNLLGRLLERSPDELDRIARAWAIELRGHDRHADVSFLYRTMTDIWAVRDVWERISPPSKTILSVLQRHEGEAQSAAQLAEATGITHDEAIREIRALYEMGIIAEDRASDGDEGAGADRGPGQFERRYFIPRELAMMIERLETEQRSPSPRDLPIDELLASVPYQEIEEAATSWGARVIPALHARSELVGLLQEQLSRPERIESRIAGMSEPVRNVWARLKTSGGVMPLDELLPPGDVPLATRRRILRELSASLLLWHGYDGDRRVAIIPKVILEPEPVREEPPPDLRTVDQSDVVEPEWLFPCAAAWDLLTIVRDVAATGPRWEALADADPVLVRRLRRRLWLADRETRDVPTGYIPFLVRVAGLSGIVREDSNGRAVPGDAAQTWREHSFMSATQKLVAAWVKAEEWIEGQERVDANLYGASWPRLREVLIRAIGELDETQWYDEERFVERLLRAEPDLLRQAQVVAMGSSRQMKMRMEVVDVQERRRDVLSLVVGSTLETACAWLGLIERSHERESASPVLRATPLGRWIAGKRVEPSLPRYGPAPLAVGANFQILLYRPTPRRIWALSAFCEIQSLDRVSTWNLTAEALIRALASGIDLDQITSFLERQNGGPLPQNVVYTLAEWDRGYRRVWLRRGVILVPEEGEESRAIAGVLTEAGLDPEVLDDGRIVLSYDEPDAGERLYRAATRALRERGFAPLTDPKALPERRRQAGSAER